MSRVPRLEAFAPALAGATDLQSVLRRVPSAEGKKKLIMCAWEVGAIDADECGLLIEAEGLETS